MELPTPEKLMQISFAQFWNGEQAKAPNGTIYYRYMIFKCKAGGAFVLENHWIPREQGGWELDQIVKRLY